MMATKTMADNTEFNAPQRKQATTNSTKAMPTDKGKAVSDTVKKAAADALRKRASQKK